MARPELNDDFKDLLAALLGAHAARVMDALRIFGAPIAAHGINQRDFESPDNVYQIGLPPRRIDILTSITGVTFAEARASTIDVTVEGLALPVLGKAALITNTRATGRAKDLVDADALEKS